MRLAILSNPDSWYRRDLERAAHERGHTVMGLPFAGLATWVGNGTEAVSHPEHGSLEVDAVLVRTMPPGSLEQVVFRMNLLARLEQQLDPTLFVRLHRGAIVRGDHDGHVVVEVVQEGDGHATSHDKVCFR